LIGSTPSSAAATFSWVRASASTTSFGDSHLAIPASRSTGSDSSSIRRVSRRRPRPQAPRR